MTAPRINICEGDTIDEKTLIEAVKDRHIRGEDDRHVLLKYQIDLGIIDDHARQMNVYDESIVSKSATSDVKISATDIFNARSYKCANLYSPVARNNTRGVSRNMKHGGSSSHVSIDVRKEIRVFRSLLRDYFRSYTNKSISESIVVNIGVKKGRLTQHLTDVFKTVIGVVFPDDKENLEELQRKYPKVKFIISNYEKISCLKEITSADMLIFTRVLYKLPNTDDLFEELKRLPNNPLIVINEPNEFTKWENPQMDRYNSCFDEDLYMATVSSIRKLEKKIRALELFTLLNFQSDRELGGNIFLLQKYKLTVSKGMQFTKNILVKYINKYVNKNSSELILADIGTGGGRYAIYLNAFFNEIVAIDKEEKRIETAKRIAAQRMVDNIKYFTTNAENMSKLKDIHKAEIILFSNSFHLMLFDEVITEIQKLPKYPLVVIKQPNEFTVKYASPSLNKYSSEFDKDRYDEHIKRLNRAESYIKTLDTFDILEYVKEKDHGVTIFVIRDKRYKIQEQTRKNADKKTTTTGGYEVIKDDSGYTIMFDILLNTKSPREKNDNIKAPMELSATQEEIVDILDRSVQCAKSESEVWHDTTVNFSTSNSIIDEIEQVVAENIPKDLPSATVKEIKDAFVLGNCPDPPPAMGQPRKPYSSLPPGIRNKSPSTSIMDDKMIESQRQIDNEKEEEFILQSSAVVKNTVSDSTVTKTLKLLGPRSTIENDRKRGLILLNMIRKIAQKYPYLLQKILDKYEIQSLDSFELTNDEKFANKIEFTPDVIEFLESIVSEYIDVETPNMRDEPEYKNNVMLKYVAFMTYKGLPDILISEAELQKI